MRELGIDLADRQPQLLTRELAGQADLVITMGRGDQCRYIPGKKYIDWDLPDPDGRPIEEVRRIETRSADECRHSRGAQQPPVIASVVRSPAPGNSGCTNGSRDTPVIRAAGGT